MTRKTLIVTIAIALPLLASTATIRPVAYPEGYRSWTHVKSMVIHPEHGLADPFEGIHHVYANDAAVAGLETNRYANGATLVFDLLAQEEGGGATQEGDRKFIGVMQYDSEQYSATGSWGFEVFAGNSKTERLVTDNGESCFGCHQAVKDDSYVFSKYRE